MKTLSLVLLALPALLSAQAAHTDTVRAPISVYQRQQLVELKAAADRIVEQQTLVLQTIVAAVKDPKTLQGWDVKLTDTAVLLIPPPPADTAKKVVAPAKPPR